MREMFRQDLHDVYDETVEVFEDVARIVRKAVPSLVQGDEELAQEIIDGDEEINERTITIEEKILQITATQSPVARDVRLLQTLVSIIMHIERIGDMSVSIAKSAIRTADGPSRQSMLDLIQAQGNLVYRVLDTTIEAMKSEDLELAAKLPELDEPIDELYKQFFREITRIKDKKELKWASKMMLASRYLERIADHSVDIGERLVFLITGERATLEELAEEILSDHKPERSDGHGSSLDDDEDDEE
ncbi:MAG: phosphate signaling complex protein PhoU [Coriobacteriia bacterium]|nr:phosphate signaling complex protein PhoU [Coriobacteriia bacterium]